MSQRWKSMRVPPGRTGKRSNQAYAAAKSLRQAARAQNRKFTRVPSGISNASVFQDVSHTPELKVLDVATLMAPALAGTGQAPNLLNGCAQGTDINQHIGRKATMKSLYWMFQGSIAPTTTGSGSVRLVIVYDKEAEGAAPTIAAGVQTDIFNADNIEAMNNLDNRDRFVVLVDEIIENIGTAGPQSFMRKGYRKVQLPMVFNASAAATVAAINTGSVYAVTWFSPATFGVAKPVMNLQTRIRFEDA